MADRPLSELFGIDEENLARRRELTRLGDAEREILSKLQPWAERVAPDMVRDFYDHQLGFAPTREFFEGVARARGVSVPTLRARLEDHQRNYFLDIFRWAEHGWGLDYYERRLAIGRAHDQIDLPLKWYLGHYAEYQRLVRKYLREHFDDEAFRARAAEAISRVFNYDMQAVGDSYLLSVFESMGLDLTSIQLAAGRDRTEHVREMKQRFRQAVQELSRLSPALREASGELTGVAHSMRESAMVTSAQADTASAAAHGINTQVQAIAGASQHLDALMAEISHQAGEASQSSQQAAEATTEAQQRVEGLGMDGEEIRSLVDNVAAVAEQASLLALNASLASAETEVQQETDSSARADQAHGLSQQANDSLGEIRSQASGIQRETRSALQALEEVSEIVGAVHERQQAIADAAARQSAMTQDATRSTAELATAGGSISQVVSAVAKTAHDTKESADRLAEVAQVLAETAEELNRAVATLCSARSQQSDDP
jgi:methyl-accepting chemotaxis protein